MTPIQRNKTVFLVSQILCGAN